MKNTNQNNELFPVFLKLNELSILVVGGGKVALEKLTAILHNSPKTKISLIALEISEEIKKMKENFTNLTLIQGKYENKYLANQQLVFSAVNDVELAKSISEDAKKAGILCNAADKPELCDYYLGSIVKKGNLKIAISTNGKSPTLAKRIKELLNDSIPVETNEVLDNLYEIRNSLKGDFDSKVKKLDKITKNFKTKDSLLKSKIKKAAFYSVLTILIMIVGHILLSYIPFANVKELGADILSNLDDNFWIYCLGGFIAQMIDGALGMAYGVSVTTFLLGLGIPSITPAVASASMHASEIFTTGSSSLVYMRYKNVNMKLFKILVWPGIIGTILGVVTVSFISKEYFSVIKPFVAIYTLSLGIIIIYRAFRKPKTRKKITKIVPVAFSGGFLDSVGGGGWGPIVTSSLLAGGRHLRYAVGSAHMAKFFVAVVSTVAFFFTIGLSHWQIIFGLVIGGMLAAPISIYFSNKIPIKKGLILVGILIIIISFRTLIKSLL
jgi:siroheme synthase-like protein